MSKVVSQESGATSTVTYPVVPALPHDSAANFATLNPIIAKGVIVYEDDDPLNPLFKMGNGTTEYNDLPYLTFPKRTTEVASGSTLTPNADTDDAYVVTALAASATIAAPSGTPRNSKTLVIRIKDNGTIRSLTWNAIYRAIGITLPTATVANKTLYIGMFYNVQDTKWDVTAVGQQA